MQQTAQNPLGTQPIGKLILKFAVPGVISLLVNSLYNIVDQIFIGHKIGYLGNGATNVIFPITITALALALMIGDGAAAYFSIKLGEGNREAARRSVGNAVTVSLVLSALFLILGLLFLDPLVTLFGATDKLRSFALDYGYIIILGLPFMTVGTALNSLIRADGSPRFAMASMILGAVINTVFDPIFIFVFDWGIQGAAIATILGQMASFLLSLFYLRRFRNVTLRRASFVPDLKLVGTIARFGTSSFVTQFTLVIVIAVNNNLLTVYGAQSAYGPEIPLTALGIVMKVNQIIVSIMVGIGVGTQPIFGFNYGAGNHARVRRAFEISAITATAASVLGFLVFQFFPQAMVSIFGSEEGLYNEFARKCFQVYLALSFTYGYQIVSGIFLQSIGKSAKATILNLSRQILFFIPMTILFAVFMGVEGMLWARPAADVLVTILTVCLVAPELGALHDPRRLNTPLLEKEV